jgi:hypothetical protein
VRFKRFTALSIVGHCFSIYSWSVQVICWSMYLYVMSAQ